MSVYRCRKCEGILNNSDLDRLSEIYGEIIPLDKIYHGWCKEDDEVQEEASSD